MQSVTYSYTGLHGHSCICKLIINKKKDLVVAFETYHNSGISITTEVENLAESVCQEFDLNKDKLTWVEVYNYDSTNDILGDKGYWSEVSFKRDLLGAFISPSWKPLGKNQIDKIKNILNEENVLEYNA